MDESSVFSQIFLIMLSLITPLVQNAKFNFSIQAMSKQSSDVCCFLLFFGGGGVVHAQNPKFGDGRFYSEKKIIRNFARFNFSRLSLAFILK